MVPADCEDRVAAHVGSDSKTTPATRSARAQAIRRRLHHLEQGTHASPAQLTQAKVSAVAAMVMSPRAWRREHVVLATLFASVTTLVAAIAPGFANATRQSLEPVRVTQAILLPEAEVAPEAIPEPAATDSAPQWTQVTVQAGQTMGDIFESQGLSAAVLHRLLEAPGAREPLTRIRAGAQFSFDIPQPGQLRAMQFERDEASRVVLTLDGDKIRQDVQERTLQRRIQMASGTIEGSLFGAGAKVGLSHGAIAEMAKVFGYDIDFAQDLRVGDRFNVVYEEVYRDGERLRAGDLLAATFVNQGKTYSAFRYQFADGTAEYFDDTGRPLKKSFLRTPVDFVRISSVFSTARKHPVLGRMRMHKGVDYAAGTGTPIQASAGDARVSPSVGRAATASTVVLDHGRGYTTLYGHMSRFGKARPGQRIAKGTVIGYVGSTGMSTGPASALRIPHQRRAPQSAGKVTLPKPEPLPTAELARFRLQTQPMLAKLQLIDGGRAYASR
jgi:murein DD-endopeptidase MepM/ murein hydrolase activator NlpD